MPGGTLDDLHACGWSHGHRVRTGRRNHGRRSVPEPRRSSRWRWIGGYSKVLR
ncbi:hypothetical protein XMIN_712 [Xanthomonas citri pv. mangiferaeindicae LMG 941]|nr:hypothetical protein XMIN_712 [Xanthomonas citri pv. mangiferaeindicae LMG 941]